ncbi:MAG: hypothetical protein KC636_01190 [Myxococcales bacterium]|nr:hypothetical protein [Myxococcales bacterium]
MGSLNVLHHAQCFDGAASAALAKAFFDLHLGPQADVRFIAKDHCRGDPYTDADFDADCTVSVDFRYTQRPGLTWFFDHHASAFQQPGDREHFVADRSGRKFHDPKAASCAGYIARIARLRFDRDLGAHANLITWADRIDSASFPDPYMPVALAAPAMRLMAFAESCRDPEEIDRFIRDLLIVPMERHAEADYVRARLGPLLARHREDIELIGARIEVTGAVAHFNLLDQPARAFNKFIPYFHYPRIPYVVSVSRGPHRRIKITAGYNPWLANEARRHNMAALLEPYGGGGHPFVAGCSFEANDEERALRAVDALVHRLSGTAARCDDPLVCT